MKKFLFLGIFLSCSTYVKAGPYDWEQTLSPDSRTLTISTTTGSPTKLLSKDSYVQRSWIVNTSSFTIFVSSVSSAVTTSSFGIPGSGGAGNAPVIWTPDGTNAPYEGELWGAASTGGVAGPSISIYRSK